MTYNHEPYIRRCLDGFLIQISKFHFEILVHEDASTDNTARILKEYETKYPHLFRCIYQSENQFKKQNTLTNILFPMSKGKYITLCEGDDYWTDPYKLQKQVDFLEKNEDYILSCHDAIVIDKKGDIISKSKLPDICKRDFSGEELMKGAFVLTLSMCFRNVLKEMPPEFSKSFNGDTFITSMLGTYGKSRYQSEIEPAVYRSHLNGIWSSKPVSSRLREQQRTYFYLYKYHKRIGSGINVEATLFEKYFSARIDYYRSFLISKKYFAALSTFCGLIFSCIYEGNIRYLIKSFRKGFSFTLIPNP